MKKIHQGDVILEAVDSIPVGARFVRKDVVMHGEITGHSHVIEGSDIYEHEGTLYCRVIVDNPMIHEDHPATKVVPRRDYRVRIQEEYFPDGSRQVKD